MANILAIGNAVVDHVVNMASYPSENTEARCLDMKTSLGGNSVNTLTVLSQMGHLCNWVGTYTLDNAGQFLIDEMNKLGINFSQAELIKKGQTPTSSVWIAKDTGSRTITHYRQLPELSFEHFAQVEIESHDWLHFEGRNSDNLLGMINLAKCFLNSQPISLEVEKERPNINDCFDKVNVLLFSQAFAAGRGYQDAHSFLKSMHQLAPQAKLFCGWGADGAYAFVDGVLYHCAAQSDIKVVDSLGAGDTFNAGVIDALSRGHSPAEALELAVRLAEKKIGQQGLTNLFANDNKPILANINNLTAHKVSVVSQGDLSIALIRHGDDVKAYVNNCPHANVPLNSMYKIEIDPRTLTIKCSVHDAFFRVDDGYCVSGPCQGKSLSPVPVIIDAQGKIMLAN